MLVKIKMICIIEVTILLIIILSIKMSNGKKLCDSVNIQEIAEWANNLPALKAQDKARRLILSKFIEEEFMPSDVQIRKTFYQFLSQPMQTVCSVPKKLGGKQNFWIKQKNLEIRKVLKILGSKLDMGLSWQLS